VLLFDKRLKEMRLKNHLTQEELAQKVGLTKTSICCYEKGTRMPTLDTLIDLSNELNVDLAYFLGADTYHVATDDVTYGINLAKDEIKLIQELRKHYPLYARLLENRIFEPDNYNKDDMEKILKDFSKTNESKPIWEKSNIIVTFSESFFDVSLLDEDVSFSTNPTPNFNSLKNEGIFVNMISPSYGGVSANVEFEFLTGYSLNYFGKGYTPFMQLYSNDSYRNRPSLIKELNNNDYYTKVVFGKDYFKSEKVYDRLGIDEYEEKDIKSEYKGYYTSDKYLIDKAIEALENKSNNEKLFYMNCTIESHMPFVIDKYKEYDVDVHSDTLTDSQTNVIKSYTQSCYDADKELRKII